jgi:hypothetical protein
LRSLLHALVQREESLVRLGLLGEELLMNRAQLLHLLLPRADRGIAADGRCCGMHRWNGHGRWRGSW